jgi:hypothetical protein
VAHGVADSSDTSENGTSLKKEKGRDSDKIVISGKDRSTDKPR